MAKKKTEPVKHGRMLRHYYDGGRLTLPAGTDVVITKYLDNQLEVKYTSVADNIQGWQRIVRKSDVMVVSERDYQAAKEMEAIHG